MRPFARVDINGVITSTGWIQDSATLPDGAIEIGEEIVDHIISQKNDEKLPLLINKELSWKDKPSRDISSIKAKKLAILDAECKKFIEFYKNGEKRYSPDKQSSFNAIALWCNMLLSQPETPKALNEACLQRMEKLISVFDWINAVLSYYYATVAEIESCKTKKDIDAINWDFEQFNDIDPVVWLEHVRF